jgi:hypothetical protein
MADAPVTHIGENSPEEVAYKLFRHIGSSESKSLGSGTTADREWILKTYAMCLETVRSPHQVGEHLKNPSLKSS